MAGLSTLQDEHETIERLLAVLPSILADAGIVGPCRPELELAAEFIDVFVLKFHHGREEDALFGLLAERGIQSDTRGNPLAHDHRELNARHGALRNALAHSEEQALEDAVTHLTVLGRLLDEHLTEERRLYAGLQRLLTDDDERELERRLLTSTPRSEGHHEKAHELLLRLGAPPKTPPRRRCA